MTDAPDRPTEDLAEELHTLGQNLKATLQAAWKSEERKHLEQEIEAGLAALQRALSETADEFAASETGQKIKSEVADLHARIRSGEVETKVRTELAAALHKVNAELEKAAGGLTLMHDIADEPPEKDSKK